MAIMLPFQVLGMIPFLGIMFSLLAFPVSIGLMVIEGMGLARMHKTDTWRGVCAALTPLFLICCCLAFLLVIAIPAFAVYGHR
jgi:hypothetical protein